MKLPALIGFIASLLAACCLPAFAIESADAGPKFYQGYNIGSCTASADGIGRVTATFEFYFDNETRENLVSKIIHVRRELAAGYFAYALRNPSSVTVAIREYSGALVWIKNCAV